MKKYLITHTLNRRLITRIEWETDNEKEVLAHANRILEEAYQEGRHRVEVFDGEYFIFSEAYYMRDGVQA